MNALRAPPVDPLMKPLIDIFYEPAGLICAYHFDASGPATLLKWDEVQKPRHRAPAFTWLHAKNADSKVRDWLKDFDGIPDHVRRFLLTSDARPCLHASDGGIYGTLADLKMGLADNDAEKGVLHYFYDRHRLITMRTQPLCSTNLLRQVVAEGRIFTNPMELFAGLLHCLADGFSDKIEHLAERVDDIEESVLSDRRSGDRIELSAIRRQLAEMRRYINPERHLLLRLTSQKPAWAPVDALNQVTQSTDILNSLHATLEALYERAKLLQEEIASQMSEQMNRNLMALSVLTALLMPATLVSGIFGMNVAGLPGLHESTSFWWVMGIMLLLGLATLWLLKRLKMW